MSFLCRTPEISFKVNLGPGTLVSHLRLGSFIKKIRNKNVNFGKPMLRYPSSYKKNSILVTPLLIFSDIKKKLCKKNSVIITKYYTSSYTRISVADPGFGWGVERDFQNIRSFLWQRYDVSYYQYPPTCQKIKNYNQIIIQNFQFNRDCTEPLGAL